MPVSSFNQIYLEFATFPGLAGMLRAVNAGSVKTEGNSENIAQILATPTTPPLLVINRNADRCNCRAEQNSRNSRYNCCRVGAKILLAVVIIVRWAILELAASQVAGR